MAHLIKTETVLTHTWLCDEPNCDEWTDGESPKGWAVLCDINDRKCYCPTHAFRSPKEVTARTGTVVMNRSELPSTKPYRPSKWYHSLRAVDWAILALLVTALVVAALK